MWRSLFVCVLFTGRRACDIQLEPSNDDCDESTCSSVVRSSTILSDVDNIPSGTDVLTICVSVLPRYGQFGLNLTNYKESPDWELSTSFDHPRHISLSTLGRTQLSFSGSTTILLLHNKALVPVTSPSWNFDLVDFEIQWGAGKEDDCAITCAGYCCHKTGECYTRHAKCDNRWQCIDGEDEIGCSRRSVTCSDEEILCPQVTSENGINGTLPRCIPFAYVCDGMEDCPIDRDRAMSRGMSPIASEDEIDCLGCALGSFLCVPDGRCITERELCNGNQDCSDGSDELNCPIMEERKVLTAAVIGSLGCCVLFVIALGCTRRLLYVQSMNSCSRARRNLQNLASILQVREAPPTYEAAMGYEPSLMNRQSRNRPWRLTRHGLRRESRRARRRRFPGSSEEQEQSRGRQTNSAIGMANDTSSMDLTSVLQENIRRSESAESLESTPRESTSAITSPEPAGDVPFLHSPSHVFRVEEGPAAGNENAESPEGVLARNEDDERKSISSQH